LASFSIQNVSGAHLIIVALICAVTALGWQSLRLKESAQRKLAASDAEITITKAEQLAAVQDAKDAVALAQTLAEKVAHLEEAEKKLRDALQPKTTGKRGDG
ncbi:MAG: hypothetical protein KKH12_11795, partial [Gammaproteobacteria bacterium]|nr:hypothetical protein [Gammaproteobacteria bacterium]